MINEQLLNPQSIVIVGGSANPHKPGGHVIQNLHATNYAGTIYAVNPKEKQVQGVPCYESVYDVPSADLAILAIPASFCVEAVEVLASQKGVRAFIIFSAGFSEESEEGREYEEKLVEICAKWDAALIGPNCIGMGNVNHTSVFTLPLPTFSPTGADLISSSGAVIVYLLESAYAKGLRFNSIWSVGNAPVTGIEEVLAYMDMHYDADKDSAIKLLYIENIKDPEKFFLHTRSLIQKGCRIAAIKSGTSESGARAASSHTGAMASSDVAIDALFRKAGIVRCYSREELITLGALFSVKPLKGRNIAIITHAGGPAVMLTDALSKGGLRVPEIAHDKAEKLRESLFAGASAANPIDLLATGNATQLGLCIDFCEKECPDIDGIAVIFGSPGLFKLFDIYSVLDEKIATCEKPIFAILPSEVTAHEETRDFISKGNVNFRDESSLARALTLSINTPLPFSYELSSEYVDVERLRREIDAIEADGYISPDKIRAILACAEIPFVQEYVSNQKEELLNKAKELSEDWKQAMVAKVVGPVHKSDAGGVILSINSEAEMAVAIDHLLAIKDAEAVLIQPMHKGMELFLGAKYEPRFGHVVLCGLGGIFVEVLKDVAAGVGPISQVEALHMIASLRTYPILRGIRGKEGINENQFAGIIVRLAQLLQNAPEIKEIDMNPLLATADTIVAVDARIRIEK